MRLRHLLYVMGVLILATSGCMRETVSPQQVLDNAAATYQTLDTYKSSGRIVSDIDTGTTKVTTETSFTVLLKKPNLYLISWSQKLPNVPEAQTGAVWSDGTKRYLYISGVRAACPMPDDSSALGAATGISGGVAATVPFMFLPMAGQSGENVFSRLGTPEMGGMEKVGGEDCFVLFGPTPISREERLWFSKASGVMRQCSRSLEAPDTGRKMPEMDDAKIEESLKAMGEKTTEENKNKYREMMQAMAKMSMKGTITETHEEISFPDLAPADFQFAMPEGTRLQESFDAMMALVRQEREAGKPSAAAPVNPPKQNGSPDKELSEDAGEVPSDTAPDGAVENNTDVLRVPGVNNP